MSDFPTPDAIRPECERCGGKIELLDDGSSHWWVHDVHPSDGHDASPVPMSDGVVSSGDDPISRERSGHGTGDAYWQKQQPADVILEKARKELHEQCRAYGAVVDYTLVARNVINSVRSDIAQATRDEALREAHAAIKVRAEDNSSMVFGSRAGLNEALLTIAEMLGKAHS